MSGMEKGDRRLRVESCRSATCRLRAASTVLFDVLGDKASRRTHMTLPTFLRVVLMGALLGATLPAEAQSNPVSAGRADPKLIEDLVAANRILAKEGVLDGYGHVSVRHNRNPNRYRAELQFCIPRGSAIGLP